jgi:large subunit ribosomal protein L4
MAKVAVYNMSGEKVSEVDLSSKVFTVEQIDANLVHNAVRTQLSSARAGTAHTKGRGEVSGGGKKPWKQKGTGRARAGSSRSPLWKGGGVTFGPTNQRNWTLKMNKSAFRKAIATILTDKLNENRVVVIDKIENVSKTKDLAAQLKALSGKSGLDGKKHVLVLAKHDSMIERAAQNLANVKVLVATQLNAVDLLAHDVILTKDAVEVIEKTYLK